MTDGPWNDYAPAAPQGPVAFPGGGGQMPSGEATNDPAVWARWLKEDAATTPAAPRAVAPNPMPADLSQHGAEAPSGTGAPIIVHAAPVAGPWDDYKPTKQTGILANAGAGTNEGTMRLLGAPVDVATGALNLGAKGVNALTGTNIPLIEHPVGGADWWMDRERAVGLDPRDVETRSTLEKLARAGGEGVADVALPGAAARALPALGGAAGAVQRMFGSGASASGAASGAAAAVGGEGAGEATQGTAAEPYARFLGTLATGVNPRLALGRAPNKMLASVLNGTTPAQFSAAQSLLNESRAAGMDLSLAEAVHYASNGITRLPELMRVVEQSAAGAAVTKPFFAQRPGQVRAGAENVFDRLSTSPVAPTEVAPRVQNATLGPPVGASPETAAGAEQARTAATSPFYTAAATDRVPPDQVEALLQQIDSTIAADKTGILHPQLTNLRDALTEKAATDTAPRVPVTDIENLNRARKTFRDAIDLPPIAADAIPKEVAKNVSGILQQLRSAMVAASPNLSKGNWLHQRLTENYVQPLQRSVTGQLAQTDKIERQLGILFGDAGRLPGSEAQISRAVHVIAATDPEVAKQLVRIHLEKAFDAASEGVGVAPNQMGGPKFAKAVAPQGTQQEKNIEAALAALPQGNVRLGAFRGMMRIFRAMGSRLAPGSPTAEKLEMQQELRGSRPVTEMAATVTSPWAAAKQAEKIFGDWRYRRNTADIARVLTTGDVSDLRRLALAPAAGLRAQAALVALIGSGAPSNDRQPQRAAQ